MFGLFGKEKKQLTWSERLQKFKSDSPHLFLSLVLYIICVFCYLFQMTMPFICYQFEKKPISMLYTCMVFFFPLLAFISIGISQWNSFVGVICHSVTATLNLGGDVLVCYLIYSQKDNMLPRIPVVWWLSFPAFGLTMLLSSISSVAIAIDDCKWQVRKAMYQLGSNSSGSNANSAHYEKMKVEDDQDI